MKKQKRFRWLLSGGVAAAVVAIASIVIRETEWLKALGGVLYKIIGIILGAIAWCGIAIAFCIADLTAPTPPEPAIQTAEFHYELQYEIDGVEKSYSNTMICKFEGLKRVGEAGSGKKQVWSREYKESTTVEELNGYHIICYPQGSAAYYLNAPDTQNRYENELEIKVNYNNGSRNLTKKEKEEFFNEHNFKVISWYCDPPIKNTF